MTPAASRTSPSSPYVASTVSILALATASSLAGLFRKGHYNDPAAFLPRLYAQDAVMLVVAVPVLAVGLWDARRGSLRGRIVWLGGLAFMTYTWASVTAQTAFNEFFLGYVALFGLSLFTLAGGLVHTDATAVRRRLDGKISNALYSGVLALLAVGLALLWLADIIPATLAGTTPPVVAELGERAAHTYVIDLGVVVPSLAITAVWLRRNHVWGYVFAGVLLVMAAVLAPALTAITAVDLAGDYVTVTTPVLVGTILPPVVAAALAVKYLLALGGRESDERETGHRETTDRRTDP